MNETHEKRTTQPFGTFFNLIYTVALLISRLLHPVSVKGLENLPRNGALLIANHSSNWDPILLATALPRDYRLRVMAKEELFRYPVVSWLIRVGGAFPVNRGGADIQAVKTAMQSIRDGQNLLIFPEGTVIRDGIGKADGLPAHAGKSGCFTRPASSSASLIRRYIPAAGEQRRRCRTLRTTCCGRFMPWAVSRWEVRPCEGDSGGKRRLLLRREASC